MSGKITKQELSPDLSNEIGILTEDLNADDPIPVSIVPGTQIVNSPRKSRVTNIGMDGRTLINIPGRDGNCESLSPFTTSGTIALSTTQKKSGSNSIKITSAGSASYGYKDYSYKLDTTKQYIFGAWVYVESFSSGTILLRLQDVGVGTSRYTASANTGITGGWQFIYVKVPTANSLVGNGFRLFIGANNPDTYVFYVDEIRIYELSAADYDAIGTTYTTDEEIDAFLPYVDDMKHVEAVQIVNPGKNLAGPFSEWTLHANCSVISPYELVFDRTASGQVNEIGVTFVKGQAYTLTVDTDNSSNDTYIHRKSDGARIAGVVGPGSVTFTPTDEDLFVRFGASTNAKYTVKNIMLNIGSTALPFERQQESHLYLWNMELASNPDGSVKDRPYMDENGNPRVTRRIGKDVLDGSLPWAYDFDYTGFKGVRLSIAGAVTNSGNVVKYDGKILQRVNTGTSATTADTQTLDASVGRIIIQIADTDSGWAQSYTPDAAKIKAYFNGWKITWAGDGSSPYDGTGSFIYKSIVDGTALTTDQMPTGLATGYTPYRLQYQLAQSIDEAVSHEGELMLHDGDNQVYMGTGIVVREAANFQLNNGNYHIDLISVSASYTKYRVSKFVSGYKGDDEDYFIIVDNATDAYGNQRAALPPSRYDQSAAYSVTYEALDKYLIGIAPQEITGEVVPNIKEAVDNLTRGLVEAKTQISVLQNTKAQKQQPQWIAPVLLNGWVNNNTSDNQAGFLKDDIGIVEVKGTIKSGSNNTICFILPKGYRPAQPRRFPVTKNDASAGQILIEPSGNITVFGFTTTWTTIDCTFRAEQ